ncbi:MAG: YhbY family RNA-binding protein, partial [Candidatus Enteromonas sp.]
LALEAKELIKVGLLQNCPLTPAEVSSAIEKGLGAETVQIIGRVIVFYRRSEKNPRIQIPVRKA